MDFVRILPEYGRIECPTHFTIDWGKRWVAAAGGDPVPIEDSWCWADFGRHYPELIPVFVDYLRGAATGDPAWAAYLAREAGWMSTEDAVAVIEGAATGDPAWVAYYARQGGWMSTEEAVAVIKGAATGDPAWIAYSARKEGWMTTEEAVAVIKGAATGDPAWAAYRGPQEGWMTPEGG